jgi:hypothetical protein
MRLSLGWPDVGNRCGPAYLATAASVPDRADKRKGDRTYEQGDAEAYRGKSLTLGRGHPFAGGNRFVSRLREVIRFELALGRANLPVVNASERR